MVARVEELGTEVLRLKVVAEKQGRQLEKWKTFVKGNTGVKNLGSVRRREKRTLVDRGEGLDLGSEDEGARADMEELNSDGGVVGDPVKNNSRVVEQREVSPQQSGRTSSEERPTLLVRLEEGDGVPSQWVEPESGDNFLYRALTSQTYFVSEEEGSSVDGGRKDYGGSGGGLDPNGLANLNALVGEVVKDVGVDGGHNQAEIGNDKCA